MIGVLSSTSKNTYLFWNCLNGVTSNVLLYLDHCFRGASTESLGLASSSLKKIVRVTFPSSGKKIFLVTLAFKVNEEITQSIKPCAKKTRSFVSKSLFCFHLILSVTFNEWKQTIHNRDEDGGSWRTISNHSGVPTPPPKYTWQRAGGGGCAIFFPLPLTFTYFY